VDVPLDEPADLPVDEPDESAGQSAGEPWRRPEPTVAAAAAEPSPVTSFPKAPEPMGPPPTAPEPSTPWRSGPEPRAFDDIDLPLDEDAAAGEATPPADGAAPAMTDAGPAAEETGPAVAEAAPAEAAPVVAEAGSAEAAPAVAEDAEPAVGERRTTKFVSNAAHDAESGASSAPASGGGSPGVIAGAAAAAGAVAAAAVAAVKKIGHSDKRAEPEDVLVVEETPPAGSAADEPPAGRAGDEAPAGRAGDEAPAGRAAGGERGEANPWAAPPPVNVEADEHADELITAYPSARPGAAGAIYGVGITVLVTDLARSIAFYRDTLGFYEIDSGDGNAVLASGDTRLVLRTVSELSAEAGRLIFLNLEVGDVEAVYAELAAKGVRFVHPPQPVNRGDRLELWSATFLDPDDHNIAITQWRAIR
jgi:catechol 2,3-dioxygenase-like lactoylglutathione lyase family enzyme